MILLTAATPWESRPLAEAWGLARQAGAPAFWRGKSRGAEVCLLETGMGPDNAERALFTLSSRLGAAAVDLAVSSGLAGALQPGVRPGDLVADPHGAPISLLEAAREAAREAGAPLHLGRIVSTSRVLCSPAQKRSLGEARRAVAADMESTQVRRWAAEAGAPFLALRAVLDGLDDSLPPDAPEGDGAAEAARYLAGHWRELPLLIRLACRQRRGMRRLAAVLGSFFGRVRECALS